ncbi:MAG: M20 family metallopeptidase [Acidimicrobiales bacterium]|nr:M20 family metallopeptidase [Acidimicrobiales bacterium]
MSTDIDDLKRRVCDEVDRLADRLIDASHQIHAHPELNYQEVFAHDLLTGVLDDLGHAPTRHAYGVDTAFEARAGEAGPEIAVLCEYDALPGIGHACGHNVIATAGLGAGLAAATLADELGGRVRIMGTPAEEGGGGKILMARQGAFEGLAAAMMVHPADADLIRMDTIAVQEMYVDYHGKAAHAAAAPQEGRNALDAAVLGYVNVAALRQHILPTERIHGVFTRAGDKANIVPAETSMTWMVRSPTIASLQPLKGRVVACLEASAAATGCSCTHSWQDVTYADMIDNGPMVASYVANAALLGRTVRDPLAIGHPVVGSTDMGNVSYLVPSIHPMIQVADDGVPIHTAAFAEFARSERGDRAVLDGAKAMAMTVIDLWADARLRDEVAAHFAGRPADGNVL